MEDDDLAHQTQQILDAIDDLLSNAKLVSHLTDSDLETIRSHRRRVADILGPYRVFGGMTERRVNQLRQVPSGSRQGMAVPLALGSVATIAPTLIETGAVGVGTGISWGTALALGEILLPIAIAVVISEITGGSLQDNMGRKLFEAVKNLQRDLLELAAITQVLAITAEAAAKMLTDELVRALVNAIQVFQLTAVAVLLAELARRFPGCIVAINAVKGLSTQLHRVKTNPSYFGSGVIEKLRQLTVDLNQALLDLRACVAYRPRADKGS
jgi:hypothetical protein